MTRKQLVAEILTELKKYDESGLIDYRSLNRWIKNELKRFGNNLMQLTERVIRVENGKADLPENFFDLYFVVKCTPESHYFEQGCKENLQNSHFWTRRLETTYEWDNQSNTHKKSDFKCIEEKFVFKDTSLRIRYNNPILLKPVKGIKKDTLSRTCKNLKVFQSPYEFNIVGEKIQLNFSDGDIYIQYFGIPLNDEGDFEIPDSRNLQEYLIAYCKSRIFKVIYDNDDDTGALTKYQISKQEANELYGLAQTDMKFNALGDWANKIKRNNILETNKYERMFPM